MTLAAEQPDDPTAPPVAPEVPEAREDADAPRSEGASSFWLHLLGWIPFHLAVVVAWGERNSWPDELLLCLLALPVSVLVIWDLYQTQGFGLAIEPEQGQQEQLIAALVLAVGLASGQLLLMSAGLVCLAVAWLRPAKPGLDWTEWLKAPLLLLGAIPFWLDFEAGRHPFTRLFDDPVGNPLYQLPLALKVSQALLLSYGGLVGMIVLLHGRIFWVALPALPAFVLLVTALPRLSPIWNELPRLARFWIPWVVGALLLGLLGKLTARFERGGRPLATGRTLRRWFEERRYPPWLAILVVAIVQALPFQAFRPDLESYLELGAMVVLTLLLGAYRLRTPKGPIHSRSVAMVAGALTLTLLAEFAASDPFRHLALGFVIIGLLSWHCFWPLRVFCVAAAAVIVLFGLAPEALPGLFENSGFRGLRFGSALLLLASLGWLVTRPLPIPGQSGYSEDGWIPAKRFALILLGLMILFQNASAFWPDHTMPLESLPRLAQVPEHSPALPPLARIPPTPRTNRPSKRRSSGSNSWSTGSTSPSSNCVATPIRSKHPNGPSNASAGPSPNRPASPSPRAKPARCKSNATAGRSRCSGGSNSATVPSPTPLYARRILWSSWHLANRPSASSASKPKAT
jgi:hypothetical protein